jgi:hypothetical protein
MDMHTGKSHEEPVDIYGDEVLNANWLPQPEMRPALQPVEREAAHSEVSVEDVEGFLASVYLHQE